MNKQRLARFISKYYLNGTVNSIVLNSNSSVFELVAYQELGFHKPGFLRSMKYFENGLDAYEGGDYAVALSRFQQAYTLSKDSLTLLYIDRCKDRVFISYLT